MPQARHGFKARHVLFRIDGVGLTNDAEKENGNVEEVDACAVDVFIGRIWGC